MPEHGIIAWLAIGLVLGLVAKFLGGGFDLTGCLVTLMSGVVGALGAGWLTAQLLGWQDPDGHYALFAAVFGGIAVLALLDILAPHRPPH